MAPGRQTREREIQVQCGEERNREREWGGGKCAFVQACNFNSGLGKGKRIGVRDQHELLRDSTSERRKAGGRKKNRIQSRVERKMWALVSTKILAAFLCKRGT